MSSRLIACGLGLAGIGSLWADQGPPAEVVEQSPPAEVVEQSPPAEVVDQDPPAEVLEALAVESYPQRVAAQRELSEWAASRGEDGIEWLLRSSAAHRDPEVRLRAFEVLRGQVLQQLEADRPGFIGVTMIGAEAEIGGEKLAAVAVTSVQKDSPADRIGLRAGDRILAIDGERWGPGDTPGQLALKVGGMKPGREIQLEIERAGKIEEHILTLAARPWSAGEWGKLQPLRIDPFRGAWVPGDFEEEARESAFRAWLDEALRCPEAREPGR